jgi:hypothetical protein
VVDLGTETYNMVSVALYDTLGKDSVGESYGYEFEEHH